jgi:hypothetical protein
MPTLATALRRADTPCMRRVACAVALIAAVGVALVTVSLAIASRLAPSHASAGARRPIPAGGRSFPGLPAISPSLTRALSAPAHHRQLPRHAKQAFVMPGSTVCYTAGPSCSETPCTEYAAQPAQTAVLASSAAVLAARAPSRSPSPRTPGCRHPRAVVPVSTTG